MTEDDNKKEVEYTKKDIFDSIRNNTAFNLTSMITDLQNKLNIAMMYDKERFDIFFHIFTRLVKFDTKISINNNLSRLYYAFHTEFMAGGVKKYIDTIDYMYSNLSKLYPNSTNLIYLASPFVKSTFELFENYNNSKMFYCMYGYIRLYDKFKNLMCDNTHVDEKYIRELAEHIILQIGKESSEVYTVLYKYIPEDKFKDYCLKVCEHFEKDCPEEDAYGDEIGVFMPNILPFSPEMREFEHLLSLLRNRGYLLYLIHNTGNSTYILPPVFTDEITIPEYFNFTMASRLVKTRFRYVFYPDGVDNVWIRFMQNINIGVFGVLPFNVISKNCHVEPMPIPQSKQNKNNGFSYMFFPESTDVLINNSYLLYALNKSTSHKSLLVMHGSSLFHNTSIVARGNVENNTLINNTLIINTDIFSIREYYRLTDVVVISSMTEKNKPFIIDAISLNLPILYLDTGVLDQSLEYSINFVSKSRDDSIAVVNENFKQWCSTVGLEDRNTEGNVLYTPKKIEINDN